MAIKITIEDTDTGQIVDETEQLEDLLVVSIKRGEDGKLILDAHEPLEVDDHPDTLRVIGGHIVAFAQKR